MCEPIGAAALASTREAGHAARIVVVNSAAPTEHRWRIARMGVIMRSAIVDLGNAKVPACGIAAMAKASVPGRTKTRLVPPLSFEQAAQCNTAFVRDIAENILAAAAQTSIAGYVAYGPADAQPFFQANLPPDIALIEACYPSLGACLDHAIAHLF